MTWCLVDAFLSALLQLTTVTELMVLLLRDFIAAWLSTNIPSGRGLYIVDVFQGFLNMKYPELLKYIANSEACSTYSSKKLLLLHVLLDGTSRIKLVVSMILDSKDLICHETTLQPKLTSTFSCLPSCLVALYFIFIHRGKENYIHFSLLFL